MLRASSGTFFAPNNNSSSTRTISSSVIPKPGIVVVLGHVARRSCWYSHQESYFRELLPTDWPERNGFLPGFASQARQDAGTPLDDTLQTATPVAKLTGKRYAPESSAR